MEQVPGLPTGMHAAQRRQGTRAPPPPAPTALAHGCRPLAPHTPFPLLSKPQNMHSPFPSPPPPPQTPAEPLHLDPHGQVAAQQEGHALGIQLLHRAHRRRKLRTPQAPSGCGGGGMKRLGRRSEQSCAARGSSSRAPQRRAHAGGHPRRRATIAASRVWARRAKPCPAHFAKARPRLSEGPRDSPSEKRTMLAAKMLACTPGPPAAPSTALTTCANKEEMRWRAPPAAASGRGGPIAPGALQPP